MATTWGYWVEQTNTYTTTTSGTIWMDWCSASTSTATAASNTWTVWCDTTGTNGTASTYYPKPVQLTPEQIAAQEAQRKAWQEIAEKERIAKEAAEARAEQLLVENLSLKQREQYAKDKHFVVERGARRYRVRRGRTGNVDVIDNRGCVSHRLCAHPGEHVPDCDTMLAQKLMLEHDDDHFMRVANRHDSHDTHTPVLSALQ